ncbi:MAG: Hpt domain-containing protein [Lachnospiraceae bacterium]|nr:Hpt domain-containing protein [Lachnospiraceae bacterium]
MLTIDSLKAFGADTDDGLGRCMGNESLYLRLAGIILQDPGFDTLRKAIEENDLDTAFEAAHALKGALGNLSLTPIYEPVCEITELLRGRTETDYAPLVGKILEGRDRLKELAKD